MITYYTIYKNNGEIIHTGTTQNIEDVNKLLGVGLSVIWEEAKEDQYVDSGVFVNLPEKPNDGYVFDYVTKTWVIDLIGLDKKAKTLRNYLLAEGPDRISPIWWSSMTPEQQQVWTDYRQALLDITTQPTYPQDILWPTKPE